MTFDKSPQDDQKPGPSTTKPSASLESDMAMLASLLTEPEEGPSEDGDDSQVTELLNRLIAADGVAQGVEERLDGIIENLDLLLTALEKASSDELPQEVTSDKAAEQSQSLK
ncbi:hypothetical protein AN958_06820 [Leucoagaricus sp. SymC.cos]|nr:hypothetical protein AN958_06820 [Leucoagaricus sp. SymC.cos]